MSSRPHKSAAFWPLAALLVLADCGTKELAVEHLSPAYTPHDVIGSVVRFTLAYNPNAAFGLSVGPHSRWVITAFAVIVVAILLRLYHGTGERDAWQATALGLVMGGAVGNALDRVRSARGVVDFVDVGLGDHRFWTFNLADIALTLGGLLLALVLWRREIGREQAISRGAEGGP